MPKICLLVEGEGEEAAAPLLVRRILHERMGLWDWNAGQALIVRSLGTLSRKLDSFIRYTQKDPDCAGVLILLDLDNANQCPRAIAVDLAAEIRLLNETVPVAVVFARREYEAWFLASLPSLVGQAKDLPEGIDVPTDLEEIRDAKGWLTERMPPGVAYKPTVHQAGWTSHVNLELAEANSRSFRRLRHAVEELVEASQQIQRGYASPVVK